MSLYRARTSALSIAPSIETHGRSLVVRTSFLLRLLSLFSYDRLVRFDPMRKSIHIHTRRFWLFQSDREVPFSRVSYIDYDFKSWGTSWAWMWRWGAERADQVESFRVAVALKDPEELVPIAAFRGEGSSMTGAAGVLFGDSLVDAEGDQEDTSRSFVEVLERLLDTRVGRPLLASDRRGSIFVCKACGRSAAPSQDKCLYCGGAIADV
jgi:hypothetical protein